MKRFKIILKLLIFGTILVSFCAVSSPQFKFTVSSFFEIQLDTLQIALNDLNKISQQKELLVDKIKNTKDSLDFFKVELLNNDQQSYLLNQEFYCEKVDSCKNILLPKILQLKMRNEELNKKNIPSLKLKLEKENSDSGEIVKKQDQQVKKIQQNAALVYGSRKILYKGGWYYIFVVNTDSSKILMHHKDTVTKRPYNSIGNVYKALAKNNLKPLMITNAGMYTSSFEPQGLFIENYKELYPIDTGKPNSNNFYLKPNGVFFIDNENKPGINTTEDFISKYRSKKNKIKFATQSGPMLLIGGEIHPVFQNNSTNRKIRSGVGIVSNKKVVFIISIDEVNFYDFAYLFKLLFNSKDALFLDGAISRMYLYDLAPQEKGGSFGPMISVVKGAQ